MDGRTREQVGALVKARRLELRITEKRLQSAAGIDAKTLKAIERGDRWPQEETRMKVEAELQWAPGSIAALREGRQPSPVRTTPDPPMEPPLRAFPDDELLAEVRRRMKGAANAVSSDQTPAPGTPTEAGPAQEDVPGERSGSSDDPKPGPLERLGEFRDGVDKLKDADDGSEETG